MVQIPRHWRAKALAQATFASLPSGRAINALGQKLVTKTAELSEDHFADKWFNATLHLPVFHEFTSLPATLELGTGWYPVTPLTLWLAGAHQVTTIDVEDLWSDHRAGHVAEAVLNAVKTDPVASKYPWSKSRQQLLHATLKSHDGALPREALAGDGLTAKVADALTVDIPPASIDLFTSNATLEHIPPEDIRRIFSHFATLAAPGAKMSHYTDLADHYAYFDSSIGYFNFLRYSDKQWRKYNNRFHYQSRARITTYRDVHAESGWHLIHEQTWSGPESELHTIPVSADFGLLSAQDLLVKHAHQVSSLQS